MKEFGLTPAEWHDLSCVDKKLLHYHRVMEGYYMDQMHEESERQAEIEKERRGFVDRLPRQVRRGR